jgi:hypothetical protein
MSDQTLSQRLRKDARSLRQSTGQRSWEGVKLADIATRAEQAADALDTLQRERDRDVRDLDNLRAKLGQGAE